MMRLQSDLDLLCLAAINGELDLHEISWDERACLGVVLAEDGYPNHYNKGSIIHGMEIPNHDPSRKIFHAGTKLIDEQLVTNGGRVLCVCALADDIKDAQIKAYEYAESITWESQYLRYDIGYKALL
jgi:phosphoribosylamine--glycine ligase